MVNAYVVDAQLPYNVAIFGPEVFHQSVMTLKTATLFATLVIMGTQKGGSVQNKGNIETLSWHN